jgi:hypothetical protein
MYKLNQERIIILFCEHQKTLTASLGLRSGKSLFITLFYEANLFLNITEEFFGFWFYWNYYT